MEFVNCNICNIDAAKFLFKAEDLNYRQGGGEFNVVQCGNCGLVYLNPRPTEEELKEFYPDNYYINADTHQNLDSQIVGAENFQKIIKILKRRGIGKILDIGCKRGDFLAQLKSAGWNVYGVEISTLASQYAQSAYGIEVINRDLLNAQLPERQFDVVSLLGTLEHLRYPLETIREIRRILKDNGLLIIYLPNFNSLQARVFKNKWFHLDAPRHLFHFEPKTIRILLQRNGFKIQHVDNFCSFANYIGLRKSILYFLADKVRVNKLYKIKKGWVYKFHFLDFLFNNFCKILAFIENTLGRGGTIFIYACANHRGDRTIR